MFFLFLFPLLLLLFFAVLFNVCGDKQNDQRKHTAPEHFEKTLETSPIISENTRKRNQMTPKLFQNEARNNCKTIQGDLRKEKKKQTNTALLLGRPRCPELSHASTPKSIKSDLKLLFRSLRKMRMSKMPFFIVCSMFRKPPDLANLAKTLYCKQKPKVGICL